MPDCEDIAGKCGELMAEVTDFAADQLSCSDEIPNKEFANYVSAAALLKLVCIMNKIAQKTYPLGDIVPPDEGFEINTVYWMGGTPRDFTLCDVIFTRKSLEGGAVSGSGSGSGSGSCDHLKFNIKITTPSLDEILIFEDYIEATDLCTKTSASGVAYSTDFQAIDNTIPECSTVEFITGDCVIGLGGRLDFLGFLPLDCK